jgi:thiol:disulfide interchange protein
MFKHLLESKLAKTLLGAAVVVLALGLVNFYNTSSILPSASATNESAVEWNRDVLTALSQAKEENKPVFVDVYADWCSWCKKLDRDVFSQDSFAGFIEDSFIPLKVNSDTNADFARRYNVSALPTMLVLNPDGAQAGRITGYMDENKLKRQLADILEYQQKTISGAP